MRGWGLSTLPFDTVFHRLGHWFDTLIVDVSDRDEKLIPRRRGGSSGRRWRRVPEDPVRDGERRRLVPRDSPVAIFHVDRLVSFDRVDGIQHPPREIL